MLLYCLCDIILYVSSMLLLLNFSLLPPFFVLFFGSVVTPVLVNLTGIILTDRSIEFLFNLYVNLVFLGCFIQTFPAFQGQVSIPSVEILKFIDTRGSATELEIINHMKKVNADSGRKKLERDKFILEDNSLSKVGLLIATIFGYYKKLMKDRSIGG
jgi:hypothetical protein